MSTGPSNNDINVAECQKGWETQREHSYWIPLVDIEGKVPQDLHGTLFRNGPGLHDVYGTTLKHRKCIIQWTYLHLYISYE